MLENTSEDLRKYMDMVDEANLTRRGILKGMGAAAASAAIPSGAVAGAVKAVAKSPLSKIKEILSVADLGDLEHYLENLNAGINDDLITQDEWQLIKEKLGNNFDKWYDGLYDEEKEDEYGDIDVDIFAEVEKILGEKPVAAKITDILGDEDPFEFFRIPEVKQEIQNVYQDFSDEDRFDDEEGFDDEGEEDHPDSDAETDELSAPEDTEVKQLSHHRNKFSSYGGTATGRFVEPMRAGATLSESMRVLADKVRI